MPQTRACLLHDFPPRQYSFFKPFSGFLLGQHHIRAGLLQYKLISDNVRHKLMTHCSMEASLYETFQINPVGDEDLSHLACIDLSNEDHAEEINLPCLHSPRKTFAPGPAYLVISPSAIRSIDKMFSPFSPS